MRTGWASRARLPGTTRGHGAALDLRIGTVLSGGAAHAVRAALQEAADLITRMPATFMTYPNGGPVLPTVRRRAPAVRDGLMIDAAFLAGFGAMEVPRAGRRAAAAFSMEARTSLPGLAETIATPSLIEVFGALQVQRLRLRHYQLVPESALPITAGPLGCQCERGGNVG